MNRVLAGDIDTMYQNTFTTPARQSLRLYTETPHNTLDCRKYANTKLRTRFFTYTVIIIRLVYGGAERR